MQVRTLLVVLSAAVIAGLGVYFTFNACEAFALAGDDVSMHVNTFVVLIACLGLAAAGATLLLHAALVRTDRRQFEALEQRIVLLEQGKLPSP